MCIIRDIIYILLVYTGRRTRTKRALHYYVYIRTIKYYFQNGASAYTWFIIVHVYTYRMYIYMYTYFDSRTAVTTLGNVIILLIDLYE